MEAEGIFVGIDVAKAQVDVAARPTGDRWTVSNDDAGISQLASRLKALEPDLVLLGASGEWELPQVAALQETSQHDYSPLRQANRGGGRSRDE